MSAKVTKKPPSAPARQPAAQPQRAAAPPQVRGLRVGLIQGGRIVEERLLRPGNKLTVGTDPDNSFVLLDRGLPKKHLLFQSANSEWTANFLNSMSGKFTKGEAMIDIAELTKGNSASSVLDAAAKGKIAIGDSTILFQVMMLEAAAAPLKLPKEIKGSALQNFDPFFVVAIIISALLHWLLISYARSIEIEEFAIAQRPEVVYERYAGQLEPIPDMTPEETEGESDGGGGGGRSAGNRGQQGGGNATTDVRSVGVLALITRDGTGGAVGEIMSDEGLGDLQQVSGQISGVQTYRGGEVRHGKPGEGGGPGGAVDAGNLGSIGSGGAETVGTGDQKVEREVKGAVGGDVGAVSGKLDRGVISSYVRSKMGGIRSCYERELKKNPALSGKITVTFTIGGDGGVVGASVSGATLSDPAVQSCVVRMVNRWKFTAPEDGGTVTVTYPFVFTAVGN